MVAAEVAGVAALGFAPKASASPFSPAHLPVAAHGHSGHHGGSRVGIGIGFGGGGYYEPVATPVASGYWTTQYQWVPTTVVTGYGPGGQPIYETRYVQQAYQVWVPVTTYATTYYRSSPSWRVGFGWWGH